jgi:ADP-heptose:LPS heptosyltransferase
MDFTIGPDSSFFHIAGANRIPGVALFGPTSGKVRTKAYPTIIHFDMKKTMACIPCWRNETSPCNVSSGFESICTTALTKPIILDRLNPMIEKVQKKVAAGALPSA